MLFISFLLLLLQNSQMRIEAIIGFVDQLAIERLLAAA